MKESTEIINSTIRYVKAELTGAEGGHDWFHTYRVWKMACRISEKEDCNQLVVELAALLHDIADSKFNDGDEEAGPRNAAFFLSELNVAGEVAEHVVKIIRHISFKGGNHQQEFRSTELDIVQDADRLDAIGAIGIARTFNYGGYKNREMYNPEIKPNLNMTKEEYKNSTAPTINHFYEKLLLLKDRMNTRTGSAIAEQRHQYMERFLNEFYDEWEGRL
ncbi:HD domain-containing protein [Marinilabilia salmonicolor]|uniref:HD domain-containing protein n=1 Tax=Marinilabilia salmonicolor TaxID=989 RepID=UPI00029B4272|nr:HD domain-containing protein [Marinilabilia salmonicolor]